MELRDVKGARTNPIRLYMNLRNLLPVFFAGSLAQGAVKLDVPSSGGGAQANLTMTQTFTTETICVENQLSEIGIFAAKVVNGNEALGRCGLNGATAGGLFSFTRNVVLFRVGEIFAFGIWHGMRYDSRDG